MSGNIKYIGKNNTVTQLPTSGFGFSVSNSDGKTNALKKFASSFTDNKTKESMTTNFTSENDLVDTITENANNPKVLNNVLEVEQTPLNNKDCSVYTISQKTSENSVSTNPLSSEGLLVRDNGEEINSLKEENQQLKEQTLTQTNEMAQKLNEMLNKKQVEIAELQSQLQSQLQLKQEGEKDVVLLLEKEIKLLKLFEEEMDLYRLRNEIGTKVNIDLQKTNMDLEKTINSMKTLLKTTSQTREQVSQTDFKPTTVEIMEKADTALSHSDVIEITEKADIALSEAKNIIADYEKEQKVNSSAGPLVSEEIPVTPVKVINIKQNNNKSMSLEELKAEIIRLAEVVYDRDMSTKDKNIAKLKGQLNQTKNNNIKTLTSFLESAKRGKFLEGGNQSRKRLKSRKAKAYKNKTKTRRYRKRSFTRRRK